MKLKNCVTTLPTSPIRQPGLGLIIMPLLADIIAKKLDICNVVSFNLNGVKLKGQNSNACCFEFLLAMCSLGITPNYIWQDSSQDHKQIDEIFETLILKNKIYKQKKKLIRCRCGAIESLAEAENQSASRQLYYRKNEKKYCKLCHSEIYQTEEDVFLFLFSEKDLSCDIYPEFYRKEIETMAHKFNGRNFLISRSRPSAFKVKYKKETYGIDVDFIWQMFLVLMRYQGYTPKILISSNKNLMASLFAISIFNLIIGENIYLIIPPYYLAPGKNRLKGEKYSCQAMLEKYGPKSLRLFLMSALNWRKKETTLNLGFLELISKMIYRIESKREITGIDDFFLAVNDKKIKQTLNEIKKTRQKFVIKDFFGIV